MKYLKLFENFTDSELEEDLKWIMVNFLDDKFQFKLEQNIHDKLFIYKIGGYDRDRLVVLKNLLEDLDENLEFYIKDLEIGIGFSEYINLYKTITSYDIENWTINDDLTIDVDDNVNLYGRKLTNLPIKFNKVSGHFNCESNKLTSLEGAPKYVGGDFIYYGNKLTSLEGSPKSVGGDFRCSNNKLTSLEGAPKSVGGNFYCSVNRLTSLEGLPQSIIGNFYCIENKLTSLEGAPKSVGGNFNCSENKLTSIEGLPEKIGGEIYCDENIKHLIPKNYKIR